MLEGGLVIKMKWTYSKLLEWTSLLDVSKGLIKLLQLNINLGLCLLCFGDLKGIRYL